VRQAVREFADRVERGSEERQDLKSQESQRVSEDVVEERTRRGIPEEIQGIFPPGPRGLFPRHIWQGPPVRNHLVNIISFLSEERRRRRCWSTYRNPTYSSLNSRKAFA
jgi:hypothetical protein